MTAALPVPELSPVIRMMYPGIQDKVDQRICPGCGAEIDPVNGFRDGMSMQEYMLTGFCQACQDGVIEEDVEVHL